MSLDIKNSGKGRKYMMHLAHYEDQGTQIFILLLSCSLSSVEDKFDPISTMKTKIIGS